jgi:putative Holliday junction resolvase
VLGFVEELRAAVRVPVETWDERLTTQEAEGALRAAGLRGARKKAKIDVVAAQIILRSYLEAHGG